MKGIPNAGQGAQSQPITHLSFSTISGKHGLACALKQRLMLPNKAGQTGRKGAGESRGCSPAAGTPTCARVRAHSPGSSKQHPLLSALQLVQRQLGFGLGFSPLWWRHLACSSSQSRAHASLAVLCIFLRLNLPAHAAAGGLAVR